MCIAFYFIAAETFPPPQWLCIAIDYKYRYVLYVNKIEMHIYINTYICVCVGVRPGRPTPPSAIESGLLNANRTLYWQPWWASTQPHALTYIHTYMHMQIHSLIVKCCRWRARLRRAVVAGAWGYWSHCRRTDARTHILSPLMSTFCCIRFL